VSLFIKLHEKTCFELESMMSKTKTEDLIESLKKLCEYAIENGASRAKFLDADAVVVDERVRLKCQVPLCPSFGIHLCCPPKNTPSVDEFRAILANYNSALLIQIDTPLCEELSTIIQSNESVGEIYENQLYFKNRKDTLDKGQLNLHKIVNKVEAKAYSMGFYFATGFIGGGCKLCSKCVTQDSGKACRHPFQARPSMEAVGIDAFKTAKNIGFELAPLKDTLARWTGLILVD
jgi:predicted metal-binding protein